MDWDMLLICLAVALAFLCAIGILFLELHNIMRKRRTEAIENYIDELVIRLQKVVVRTVAECMDILPEKILEAKKTIEGE